MNPDPNAYGANFPRPEQWPDPYQGNGYPPTSSDPVFPPFNPYGKQAPDPRGQRGGQPSQQEMDAMFFSFEQAMSDSPLPPTTANSYQPFNQELAHGSLFQFATTNNGVPPIPLTPHESASVYPGVSAQASSYQMPNHLLPTQHAATNPYRQASGMPSMSSGASPMNSTRSMSGAASIPRSPVAEAPRRISLGKLALLIVAMLVIVGGLVAAIAVPFRNQQVATDRAYATATSSVHTAAATVQAQATATARVYATASAVASTYPFSTTLKLDDELANNSRGNGWVTDKGCAFGADGYRASEPNANTYYTCPALKTRFSNFTYQVSVRVAQGKMAGITFRGDDAQVKYYSFVCGPDGTYWLFLYTKDGTPPQTLAQGITTHFNAGKTNQLAVVARGNRIGLYVNTFELVTVNDSTLSSGQIGTVVYNAGAPVEAVFSQAKVWQL